MMKFRFGSKSSTPSPVTRAKPLRVLVIDDNDQFCQFIRSLLESHCFEVVAFTSPVKALELFSHDQHAFDLILLDYFMPRLDGAKTCEWLRKLNPNIKVLLCSGADEVMLRQLVTQYGINGYMRKPFVIQEGLDLINNVINGSPVVV